MKLLIAADIFPPESGGPATYCVTLANEFTKQGIEVVIISHYPKSDPKVLNKNVKLYPVCCRGKIIRYVHYLWLLFWKSKNCDRIYAMGPVNAGWPALMVSTLLRKKFFVKVVGDYAWEQGVQRFGVKELLDDFPTKNNHSLMVKILKYIERMVVRRADKVIVPSKYLVKKVENWGVNKEKIKLIYNDEKYIPVNSIKHEGEKWLVSAGRLMPWKGMETLIEVISDISKQFPESMWKLKIIGDGPEMSNLSKKVTDENLSDIVQLTGNLSKEKALAYIASADVFVLNSSYEGFSHVLIEAHNQGVPVLASNVGGNSEMVAYPALFEYNNKKEIEEKVLLVSTLGKRESIRHSFGNDMVKQTLEEICDN